MDITGFLTARLDEREQWARHAEHALGTKYDPLMLAASETVSVSLVALYREARPERVLADVKAKRAILALHGLETLSLPPAPYELPEGFTGKFVGYCQLCSEIDGSEGLNTYYEPWPCPSVRILAGIDAEHPDYKQAWTVS